jgi:hypothetical protein|tara:strand:- start:158 stop:1810 length:1653 start_codon:yes stop_codon:yes gene_type:complete
MKNISLAVILFFLSINIFAQNNGEIHGDFDLNMQSYIEDATINAVAADEVIRNNSFLNIIFTKNNFSAGLRYESYLNALLDYDDDFKGNGIPYRFATYSIEGLEVTAGNFYEQFGSGLIFRSYEEKGLGIDNAMDGIRLKYKLLKGISLKTFIGKSRTYFTYADGIFRGIDGEIDLNETLELQSKTRYIFGGSFISRYQQRNNPVFELPQNVGLYAGRLNIINGGWNYYGEYAYKINDPVNSIQADAVNYASGNAFTSSLTFSKRGFGITGEIHRADNMLLLSDRDRIGKAYIMNYIPTLSKPHAYTLLALYPCATQAMGELGVQLDIFYKIKKGSLLGGKYGTKLNLNFSRINGLNNGNSLKNDLTNHEPILISFKGEELYFADINLEVNKKVNKRIRYNFVIANQTYNKDFLEGKTPGEYGVINSTIGVLDLSYKIKKGHTLRMEVQTLIAKQLETASKKEEGDWVMALAEYTISPNWFFTIQDMYNYGNDDESKRLHYININFGFLKGANRFSIGYGKKREGIFCVGGVCKLVPSSNGLNLNITSSF